MKAANSHMPEKSKREEKKEEVRKRKEKEERGAEEREEYSVPSNKYGCATVYVNITKVIKLTYGLTEIIIQN